MVHRASEGATTESTGHGSKGPSASESPATSSAHAAPVSRSPPRRRTQDRDPFVAAQKLLQRPRLITTPRDRLRRPAHPRHDASVRNLRGAFSTHVPETAGMRVHGAGVPRQAESHGSTAPPPTRAAERRHARAVRPRNVGTSGGRSPPEPVPRRRRVSDIDVDSRPITPLRRVRAARKPPRASGSTPISVATGAETRVPIKASQPADSGRAAGSDAIVSGWDSQVE